jgi:hypothetical protein
LQVLKRELEFVEEGGYRSPQRWGVPFIFEDSPTCLRNPDSNCPSSGCALLRFVPVEHRSRPAACRYIALNEAGQTVDSLYRTGTQQQLEAALRRWLIATIGRLESDVGDNSAGLCR